MLHSAVIMGKSPPILYMPPSSFYENLSKKNKSSKKCLEISQSIVSSSIIPSIIINQTLVAFTLNDEQKPAVFLNKKRITNFKEVIDELGLSGNFSKKLLNDIALISNYLLDGTKYVYVTRTASLRENNFSYIVKEGHGYLRVCKDSLRDDEFKLIAIQPDEVKFSTLSYSSES